MGRFSLDYVKGHYDVPVKRGMRVKVQHGPWPQPSRWVDATVTCGDAQYVRVRVAGYKRSGRYHPLSIDYLDGTSPRARLDAHNRRIDKRNEWLNAPRKEADADHRQPEGVA